MQNVKNTTILDRYKIKYLFHMTHIDNLSSILQHGLLPHGNPYKKKTLVIMMSTVEELVVSQFMASRSMTMCHYISTLAIQCYILEGIYKMILSF